MQHSTWLGSSRRAASGGCSAGLNARERITAWCVFYLFPDSAYSPGVSQLSATLYLARIGACRARWAKQAGGASGIARSACATMRVPRRPGGVLWTQYSPRPTPGSAYCILPTGCLFYFSSVVFNARESRTQSAKLGGAEPLPYKCETTLRDTLR